MRIVLLSGGSGQRLWPLSNDSYSKQYIKVVQHDVEAVGEKDRKCSMLQRVYEQMEALGLGEEIIITANETQKEVIISQLTGKKINIAVEPMRRDTFPAVVLSCAYLSTECHVKDEEVVVFLPIDPYVTLDYFKKIINLAQLLEKQENAIGLLGAVPTYASGKYGYIITSNMENGYYKVSDFEEKPDEFRAQQLIDAGALWNCGVFCFKLGTARQWLKKYRLPMNYKEIVARYEELPKISFDYEILEHWTKIIALSYEGMWKDIGTWNTLTEEMQEQFVGKGIMDETSSGCHVVNTLDIPIVLIGGQNLIVSASYDGLLVAEKQQSSYIKQYLNQMQIKPRYEEKYWGTIKTLDHSEKEGQFFCTNKVKVLEGQQTPYHCHQMHEELLTILSGEGELEKENKKISLLSGTTVSIFRGEFHSIRAIKELRYIEVLIGNLIEEEMK